MNVKKAHVESLVWVVALCGLETWTILKAKRAKIEAFEKLKKSTELIS